MHEKQHWNVTFFDDTYIRLVHLHLEKKKQCPIF